MNCGIFLYKRINIWKIPGNFEKVIAFIAKFQANVPYKSIHAFLYAILL